MRITVVGLGYVGLVAGACLAEAGHDVLCFDRDVSRIDLLEAGGIPIFEPGLMEVVHAAREAGRLRFSAGADKAIADAEIIFLAVGTPQRADGGTDLEQIYAAATAIGERMAHPCLIVVKSTVPVGTGERLERLIARTLRQRRISVRFAVASNPEFMREGAAVSDFRHPDRIVIGSDEDWALDRLRRLYAPFAHDERAIIEMDRRSAELTKYAANAMLATRISFMNELSDLSARLDADIDAVRRGIGGDRRIGPHFLAPGVGYGGSCLPKDVRALIRMARENDVELGLLEATERANERRRRILFRMISDFYAERGGLRDRIVALWGIAFKPNTDDIREAPSRALIEDLLRCGASVRAYDPAASGQARALYGAREGMRICGSAGEALAGSDSLAVLTEWEEFRTADPASIASALRDKAVFDGRNLFDPRAMASHGLHHVRIGYAPPVRTLSDPVA